MDCLGVAITCVTCNYILSTFANGLGPALGAGG